MSYVIKTENLGKSYSIGHQRQEGYQTLRDSLMHTGRGLWQRVRHPLSPNREEVDIEEFWALRDICLEIRQGDRIGVIGRNGAGKSTLLKILSRITEPTEGRVRIRGRVASLLEVGTGFHRELTGRENIFLNGAVLGMTRQEIKQKFDEIVAFSEVDKFLDTPVKRYSSGMYVRLAFAVAAHLEPEIMLVDEVLAVGDAAFQKKCLGKMEDVSSDGKTIMFVSHNMVAVQKLCQTVIWLQQGRLQQIGPTEAVVNEYLNSAVEANTEREWQNEQEAPGNDQVRIKRIFIRPYDHISDACLSIDHDIEIGIEFRSFLNRQNMAVTLHIITDTGVVAFSTSTAHDQALREKHTDAGFHLAGCRIPAGLLNSGGYSIKLLLVLNQSNVVFKMEEALFFNILDSAERRGAYLGRRPGVFAPVLDWKMETVSESPRAD